MSYDFLKHSCSFIIGGILLSNAAISQEADDMESRDLSLLQQQIDDLKTPNDDQSLNNSETQNNAEVEEEEDKPIYTWNAGPRFESRDGRFSFR